MLWILVGAILFVVIWLWRIGMRPAANDLESPEAVMMTLEYLVQRGINGSKARFQVKDDPSRCLDVIKTIHDDGTVSVRACFSDPDWTHVHSSRLREELDQRGIKYRELAASSASDVTIELDRDLGLAHLVIRIVFELILRVRLERECVVYFEGVLLSDEPSLTGIKRSNE